MHVQDLLARAPKGEEQAEAGDKEGWEQVECDRRLSPNQAEPVEGL